MLMNVTVNNEVLRVYGCQNEAAVCRMKFLSKIKLSDPDRHKQATVKVLDYIYWLHQRYQN